jgi:hypothetical protein
LIQRANQAFNDYLRLQGEKQFGSAAEQLDALAQTLNELAAGATNAP